MSSGSSNLLLIDILGTDYNLPSTDEDDGPELTLITQAMDEIISNSVDSPSLIYDRSQVFQWKYYAPTPKGLCYSTSR